MGKRLITSAMGIILFFVIVLSHQYVLYIAGTALVLGMLYEMYNVMCVSRFLRYIGYFTAVIVCGGFIVGKQTSGMIIALMIFMLTVIAAHGKTASKKVLSVGFITIAIAVLTSMLFLLRKQFDQYTVILPFVCAWMTDTGAYLIGISWGKHKLAENISPKKTIEGAVGGIIFAIMGTVLYLYILVAVMTAKTPTTVAVLKFVVLGFTTSIIAQLGDLFASCIKRDYEKKDYGNILPGHGGLLDRFDSVLLVIPLVYYMMWHFILR